MNHFVTILMVAVAERETSSQLIPNENDHLCLITVQCSLVRDRILNCHNTQLGRRINQDPSCRSLVWSLKYPWCQVIMRVSCREEGSVLTPTSEPRDYRVTLYSFLWHSLNLDTRSLQSAPLEHSAILLLRCSQYLDWLLTCFSCQSKSHQRRGLHLQFITVARMNKIIIRK